jgi:hypothetical protein
MTTHDDRAVTSIPVESEPEAVAAAWAGGPGHAFPATATGVPLSAFAFAFAVGVLGLVDTGILPSAASGMFIATVSCSAVPSAWLTRGSCCPPG